MQPGGICVCVVQRGPTPGGPGSGLRPGRKRFLGASNDHNPNARPESAFYMLHMAYDTAVTGGQSNTTDPTNSIVTLAGLPL